MINLRENTILREIPNNLLHDEKVVHLAKALDKTLEDRTEWAYKINYTIDLNAVDDEILDYLLWEKHIGWSEGLALATTRQQKINLIEAALDLHRQKGTPYAIERVLEALKLPGEVIEWFQYNGQPYRFKVEVTVTELSKETLVLLRQLINEYKNKRSWLDFVAVRLPQNQSIEVDCAHYHFPVFLPICGEIHCEGMPGTEEATEMTIEALNFSYPVQLPICNEIYPSEVKIE